MSALLIYPHKVLLPLSMDDWVPELEVQMVPQRRALAVQLKMVELMQLGTLLQVASFLELIPQELLEELLRLSVLVGWHC